MADFLRLSDAKTQAAECRRLSALNIDPKAVRDEKRAPKAEPEPTPTFKEFFEARTNELEKLKNYRSPRGFPDFKRRIGKHIIESSDLGALRIDEIKLADIARALAPLFEEKPKTASVLTCHHSVR